MNFRSCIGLLLLSTGLGWGKEVPVTDLESLDEAFRQAQPGDTIVMADGDWKDAGIVFRAKGTAEAPVTLRARTPGKVVLSGESSLRFVGACSLRTERWLRAMSCPFAATAMKRRATAG